ncbi:MAG: SO_0444 family Cu/Zn efflux transporter, partial [Ectothiorhodospiraceae bacterium]|nr:SO_0444 family Cu/Zn efflux transporter [Ectothiorhodospiraceae bacterium]
MQTIGEVLSLALAAAPWLVFGFLGAGLIKALVPQELLSRWVGGNGFGAIFRAALTGAPLPLCSCGAIPTALSLRRQGAGRGPTTAFLVSTPGVGVDSVAITYAVLGPFMVLMRVLGALVTAVTTGLLVAATDRDSRAASVVAGTDSGGCGNACGGGHDHGAVHVATPVGVRLRQGIRYAFTDLLDDISAWLLAGLLVAGLIATFAPPQALAGLGGGIWARLLMAVIGIPMYICATAATPIPAAMRLAGVSPGTVLVFLRAGPVT